MTNELEINPDALRAKAAAASSLSEQLSGVALGAAVDPVEGALAGSRSGPAAAALAEGWLARVRNLARDVDGYAEAVRSSVEEMQHVDVDGGTVFDGQRSWGGYDGLPAQDPPSRPVPLGGGRTWGGVPENGSGLGGGDEGPAGGSLRGEW